MARRKAWHWAVAWGCESTRVTRSGARSVAAIRWWRTGWITSARIQSAPSAAASWSRVWFTEPSIEFSIGTSASGTSPSRTARKHSTTVG